MTSTPSHVAADGGLAHRVGGRLRGRLPGRRRHAWVFFIAPGAIYMIAMFGLPLLYNIRMSFEGYDGAALYTGHAPWVGLKNYAAVLTDPGTRDSLSITLLFTVASVALTFLLGLGLAVFFTRDFPLNRTLRGALLIPWLLPVVVSGQAFKLILNSRNGVVNQLLMDAHVISQPIAWLESTKIALISVIMVAVWAGIPFNAVILHGGLEQIPVEYYEAAGLDGATRWQMFRMISLPLLRPTIGIVVLLGLIYSLQTFDIIQVLTGGGPVGSTTTLALYQYNLSFGSLNFGQGAAVGNLLIVVSIVFGLGYLRLVKEEQ